MEGLFHLINNKKQLESMSSYYAHMHTHAPKSACRHLPHTHTHKMTKARQWSGSTDTFVLENDCTIGIRAAKMRSGEKK